MIKTTAFIGLGLCVLLLSGCAPKIDGSSDVAYESSLIKITSSLDSEKKILFSQALDIVVANAPQTSELSADANKRAALTNKSADDIINEATQISINVLNSQSGPSNDNESKVSTVISNISLRVLQISEKSSRYMLNVKVGAKYDAVIEIVNRNTFPIDGLTAQIAGIDENGTARGWVGTVCFGRHKLQGEIPAGSSRKVHAWILDTPIQVCDTGDVFEDDEVYELKSDWPYSEDAGLPMNRNLSITNMIQTVYSGDTKFKNQKVTNGTLPEDIDHFLTLIKYKR